MEGESSAITHVEITIASMIDLCLLYSVDLNNPYRDFYECLQTYIRSSGLSSRKEELFQSVCEDESVPKHIDYSVGRTVSSMALEATDGSSTLQVPTRLEVRLCEQS